MGIQCRIIRDKAGKVSYVEAPNGNRSKLYDNAVTAVGEQGALDVLLAAYTPSFTEEVKNAKISEFRRQLVDNINNLPTTTSSNISLNLNGLNYDIDPATMKMVVEDLGNGESLITFKVDLEAKKAIKNTYEILEYDSEYEEWLVNTEEVGEVTVSLPEDATQAEIHEATTEAIEELVKEYQEAMKPVVYRGIQGEYSDKFEGMQFFAEKESYANVWGRNVEKFNIDARDVLNLNEWNEKWGLNNADFGQGYLTIHSDNFDNVLEYQEHIYSKLLSESGNSEYAEAESTAFIKEFLAAKAVYGEDIGNRGQNVYAVRDKSLVTPSNKSIKFSIGDAHQAIREKREREASIFYSNAVRGVEKVNPQPKTPEQWARAIEKEGGKGTSQELEWLGLEDYLNGYLKENGGKSVSKDVVEQYIKDNQIEIEEVTKQGITEDDIQTLMEDEVGEDMDRDDAIAYLEDEDNEGQAKYGTYTLEGGENYREILLTMPNKNLQKLNEEYFRLHSVPYTEEVGRQIESLERKIIKERGEGKRRQEYKSSHWDESNILAHVRMNERTLPNGERVLFVEEIQSDWAQEGKKKGFVEKINPKTKEEVEQEEAEIDRISKEEFGLKYTNIPALEEIGTPEALAHVKRIIANTNDYIALTESGKRDLNRDKTPDMPYKKTDQWVGMASRRVLQMAAQQGFDRVAWVTGQQSADRYDLSKQVDSISYEDLKDGKYRIVVYKGDTGVHRAELTESELEAQLGKEVTKKIVNDESTNRNEKTGVNFLEGLDLQVGGEGMLEFYDTILKNSVRNEARRFDKNANVDVINIQTKETARSNKDLADLPQNVLNEVDAFEDGAIKIEELNNRLEKLGYFAKARDGEFVSEVHKIEGNTSQQFSVKITDKMKEALKSSIPLFQRKSAKSTTPKVLLEGLVEKLKKTGLAKDVVITDTKGINEVLTKTGQASKFKEGINGFVVDNVVYINSDIAGLDTPVHEFGHLWNVWAQENVPHIYNRGIELMNSKAGDKYIEFVKANQPNLKGDALLEEALAQAIGDGGKRIVDKRAKENFLNWLAGLWKYLLNKTGILTHDVNRTIGELSLEEFAEAVAIDLFKGNTSYSRPLPVIPITDAAVAPKVIVKKEGHALSFVKESDLVDMEAFLQKASDEESRVSFWMGDQLGRGTYKDSTGQEHYMDAGLSYALDPINRERGVVWASGAPRKTLQGLIDKSDYVIIMSGSPQGAKLFNKAVFDVFISRVGDFKTFKDAIMPVATKPMKDAIKNHDSWDSLRDSTDRKSVLSETLAAQETKASKMKGVLTDFNGFVDYNSMRDGFLADNNFDINDMMLVLKVTGVGEKSAHSTYEWEVLGDVIGVADRRISAFDVLERNRREYAGDHLGNSAQQQVIAPYGIGTDRRIQFSLAENKTGQTQGFFSDVVTGKSDKFKAKKEWSPVIGFTKPESGFKVIYDKFKGNFDNHIATSIPTFRETQVKVGNAIVEMFKGKDALVYDIGGSEGGFVKAITEQSGGSIRSINVDVNQDMQAVHEANPVEGSEFVNEAFFEAYTEDSGKSFKRHVPSEKADVVHESMVFQFITPERKAFIKEIKDNYIKKDGIVLLEEKLSTENEATWLLNEKKKNVYKSNYYTQEELTQKQEQVLVGMKENQTLREGLLQELEQQFKYVGEYWDSGNFKGYYATDSVLKRDSFLDKIGGKITSEFSEGIHMPDGYKDITQGQVTSLLMNGQWGSLTAENPVGKSTLNKEEQEFRNFEARLWLKARGYEAIPIKGKYKKEENSFLVPSLTSQDAVDFAIKYDQESVATDQGLLYRDGTMNLRNKSKDSYGGTFEGKFSTMEIDGNSFSYSIYYNDQVKSPIEGIEIKTKEEIDGIIEDRGNIPHLTRDGEGNYVFYHWSSKERNEIDPSKSGSNPNNITSSTEASAISKVGGVAMFYTKYADKEAGTGTYGHLVKIPMGKVYDMNKDTDNLLPLARKRFESKYPNLGFDANHQAAFITQIAMEKGYDMAVIKWGALYRAQTTKALLPDEKEILENGKMKSTFTDYSSGKRKFAVGFMHTKSTPEGEQVTLSNVDDKVQGKGIGTEMYKKAAGSLAEEGKSLMSDFNSKGAEGIWNKMEQAGISEKAEVNGKTVNKVKQLPSESFDSNGEPNVKDVIQFIQSKNFEGQVLSKEEEIEVRNLMIGTTFTSSEEVYKAMRRGFTPQGMYNPSEASLVASGLYSKVEARRLLDSEERQLKAYEMMHKLKNSDTVLNETEIDGTYITLTTDYNSFGLLKKTNPYLNKKEVTEKLGAIKDEVLFANQAEANNMEYANKKFEELSQLTKVRIVDEAGNQTTNLDNLRTKMLETLTSPSDPQLIQSLDYLLEVPAEVWNMEYSNVSTILKDLETRAIDIGLDIVGITEIAYDKTPAEVKEMLNSIRNFAKVQNETTFEILLGEYTSFFGLESVPNMRILKLNEEVSQKTLYNLDTEIGSFDLFNTLGLLPLGSNLYQKVNTNKSTEEVTEIVYETVKENNALIPARAFKAGFDGTKLDADYVTNPKNKEYVIKDILNYAEEVAKEIENSSQYDVDALKKMALFTIFFKTKVNNTKESPSVSSENQMIANYPKNAEYLTGEFIADFNKEIIKSKIKDTTKYNNFYKHFEVSAKGIELVNTDPITMTEILPYLTENLKNHFRLKKQGFNFDAVNEATNDAANEAVMRNYYMNYPQALSKFDGNYQMDKDTLITNVDKDFIRVDEGVFEYIETVGNKALYGKIDTNPTNYKYYDASLGAPNLGDISKFNITAGVKADKKINNLYNNKQGIEITNKIDNC